MPAAFRTEAVCLAACTGPHSDWGGIAQVPDALRTPALVLATVSRHPWAVNLLAESQRTLAVYEAAAANTDLAAFTQLAVSPALSADPRYRALLAGFAKQSGTSG